MPSLLVELEVLLTFPSGWPETVILLIYASQRAEITGTRLGPYTFSFSLFFLRQDLTL
jgi:hypothetical protein